MKHISSYVSFFILLAGLLAFSPAVVSAGDWPFWRGPENNGISRETGLPDDWNPRGGEGSNVSWKRDDLGTRSTPVVLGERLYIITRNHPGTKIEGEKVVCINAKTGETIWENAFNVWLSDVPDTRVGWSSCNVDPKTGLVYALGVCGYFQCINGETGQTVWSVPLHETYGLLSTYGGRTNFPVICDDLVIISAIVIGWGDQAKPSHRFLAFDKKSGQLVWNNGTRPLPYDTTYSSPTVTVVDGQKLLIFGSGDGAVWAFQPRTGKQVWRYPFSRRGLNVAPLVVGDRVFTGHSEENIEGTAMGAIAAIYAKGSGDISKTGELWKTTELMMGKSSPLLIDGRLYCFDDRAKLRVLDAQTGQPVAARKALGTAMRASPLYADGKIYALTANGKWYILRPDQQGVEVVSKGRLPRGEGVDASPICAHGRVYITTSGGLYCLEDKSKKHGESAAPKPEEETPVSEDEKPAQVQVVPAEAVVAPGEGQQFKVRLFNARGQFLGESPAEFSLQGSGQIDKNGAFLASADSAFTATTVVANVAGLSGVARVRNIPPLPWKFDFEGMSAPPVVWVGARYRHIIREIDGNNVMVKISTIPKGARSRAWFGRPELSNYTIQADVQGTLQNGKMPDIGLVAQGYALDLQGANQRLQVRSWVTQLRMAATIDFPWKPGVWYTMKLRAAIEDGKAVLRGKVWVKGEPEPDHWTIEATDDSPNLTGAPGLFGNAKNAEIFLDNISVTPNDITP